MASIDSKLLSTVRYRCIGPSRGGRVVAVAADPVDRSVFYFGAVAGGVWRSDDAGLYWENITDGQLTSCSIGALAVAPSDGNVIYAGTGETTIRIDVTHGDGMYRTTDGGRHWHHIGLTDSRHIGAIAVHPDNPDLVYVAALGHASKPNPERGVYRSADGGATWEQVLHVSPAAGAVDLSMDPNNPRILFATFWETRRTFWSIESGGPGSGLWRSLDGGDTWEELSTRPGLPEGTLGKIGVAVSPARSGRVWAIVEAEDRKRGLYRSDDNGETWTKTSSKPDLTWRPWYYMHVIAHPTDPDTVYVMDQAAWVSVDGGKEFTELHTPHGDNHDLWIDPNDPDRMIGCDDGGAWVSLNGGRSWSSIYNQNTAQFYHVAVDDQYPYRVYGTQQDNSSLSVPSQTGTGVISWGHCEVAGTGESGHIAPKPGHPDVVFVGAIGSSPGGGDALQRYDRATGQIRLVSVWPEVYHDGNSAEVRFQWTYPIVFSPHDPDVLYVCGNRVFRSTDDGHSWEPISPDLTRAEPDTLGVSGPLTMDLAGAEMYGTVFSFLASAHRAGVLMAGSDDGLVHVSTDDGATWTDITPDDLPAHSQVTCLAESPHDEGTVFMTVARHKMGDYAPYVYRTHDLGQTWTLITGGLPEDDFCRVVREDPNRQGLLYLGTELGLYTSFDGGQHWQPLQANLPVCPIYDLVVKDTDLVVATHGRSFWILDDLTPLHQMDNEVVSAPAHLFAPRPTVRTPADLFAGFWERTGGKNYLVTIGQAGTYHYDVADTGHTEMRIIDGGDDLPRGPVFSYWLGSEPSEPITVTITGPDGEEVDTFTSDIPEAKDDRHGLYLTANEGMNTFRWDMRHPEGPKMVDATFHSRPVGPLAQPGVYQVTLTVGDHSMSQDLELTTDPRVTVSPEALAEQFDLARRIQTTLNEVVGAVNQIRSLKGQLEGWSERLNGAGDLTERATELVEALVAIEHELVQVELTSPGDSLNYRNMLFEKLTALQPVVASADGPPTTQSWQVYQKLSDLIDTQLGALGALIGGDLAQFNRDLATLGVDIVGTPVPAPA